LATIETTSVVGLSFLFIVFAWRVTIRQRDAWPFACFPMFSTPIVPDGLRVHRIGLQDVRGRLCWWRPHFYKMQLTLGMRMSAALCSPLDQHKRLTYVLAEILRCVAAERNSVGVVAVCIVERTCTRNIEGVWQVADRTIIRALLSSAPQQGSR
jgi:hypothetical protein